MRSLALALGVLTSPGPALAANAPLNFSQPDLAAAARALPLRARTEIVGVELADGQPEAVFELERFAVFAPDAVVEVHGEGGSSSYLPLPDNAYLRGTIAGRPDTRVVLTAFEDGTLHGWVVEPGRLLALGEDADAGGRLVAREVDLKRASDRPPFRCAQGEFLAPEPDAVFAGLAPRAPSVRAAYTARVAVETDFEFHTLLGSNTSNSLNYVGDLFAYSSSIYDAEVDTTLLVSSVSLWSTAADPWEQTGSTCALMEFGRYWNVNRSGVSRTTTHMLSGKFTGGGVAWVGVLCGGPFTANGVTCSGLPAQTSPPDVWGGNYGFTGSLWGTFNLGSPSQMWDIIAMSHELGHNFNSPHTHCYNGIGGNSSPVDGCYNVQSGCYAGTSALPGAGSLTGGTAGASNGTLMSYCHLLGGGYPNVALTFGPTHPFGVAPERVPTRMHDHVVQRASTYPGCLTFTPPTKGDFTLDRQADLVLRNPSTGAHKFWAMSGTTLSYEANLSPTPAANELIVGADDFNADQRSDVVIHNQTTGAVEFWMMKSTGARWGSPVPLSGAAPLALTWRLAATADFNADGWPDLLWRDSASQNLVVWTMNGTARIGTITPNPSQALDPNWTVVATLDYNADAATDLLWYNSTSGKAVIWFMNASVVRINGNFTTPANAGNNNWKILASSDFGVGAGGLVGTNDIVWRNETSGKFVVWHMNNAGTRTAGVFTTPDSPASPLSWTIAGPR